MKNGLRKQLKDQRLKYEDCHNISLTQWQLDHLIKQKFLICDNREIIEVIE